MFRKLLIVIVVLIVGFLGYVATRPATFHIERSTTIAATPDVVFANVADFERWAAWSPWEKLDPEMKKTIEGPGGAVGSTYHWTGNNEVGEGRMTITDILPAENVGIKLEFIKPFAAVSQTTFEIEEADAGTLVTWNMDGANNFMAKAMGVFMNMDQMIGKDLEEGLVNLKGVAEAETQPAPADTTAAQ